MTPEKKEEFKLRISQALSRKSAVSFETLVNFVADQVTVYDSVATRISMMPQWKTLGKNIIEHEFKIQNTKEGSSRIIKVIEDLDNRTLGIKPNNFISNDNF
jgi:hypothetical protein